MSFSKVPNVSKKLLDRHGETLAKSENWTSETEALSCVNQWREAHAYTINTFRANLAKKLRAKYETETLLVQRLKRMPTIINKLRRTENSYMKITQMQDIAGLRVIFSRIDDVYRLADDLKNKSNFKHNLIDEKDHINKPRSTDGYRSLHLVYKYQSKNHSGSHYDGLRIELQIRTKLQHSWATAVETVDMILNDSLKFRQGDARWQYFFTLVSNAFSFKERTTPVLPELSYEKTLLELKVLQAELKVNDILAGFSVASRDIQKGTRWASHLITLNVTEKKVRIESFTEEKVAEAAKRYAAVEKEAHNNKSLYPVLVSAEKVDQLMRAYPNYFGDTKYFLTELNALK